LSLLASRLQNDFAYKAAMLGYQDYIVNVVLCLVSMLVSFVWAYETAMLGYKRELFVHFLCTFVFLLVLFVYLLGWLELTGVMLRNKSQFYLPFKVILLSKFSDFMRVFYLWLLSMFRCQC